MFQPRPRIAPAAPYRMFFIAGIATVLTVGAAWGAWLLWQIGAIGKFTGVSIHQVNAHGHAQVFGWVGLFVMGFAYQMFPALWQRRLLAPRLVPVVFAAMVLGIAVRTAAMASTGAGWAIPAVVVGGALEIAAILAFTIQLAFTWRASFARRQPYLPFVATAFIFFFVQAVFCVWHTVNTMGAGDRAALLRYVATYQAVLRDLQIHGFVLFIVLGVSIQLLPRLYGVAEVTRRRARIAWTLLLGGVVGEITFFLLYRLTGRHAFAAFLLVPWLMLSIGALSIGAVFRPWRAFPRADRSAKLVRAAYLWLAASFALLLLLPLYQAAVGLPFSHAYYGSIRHAITVGFASQMILGIAARVVPDLRGRRSDALSPLWGPFLLLNTGCFLRVTLQAATDVHPIFFGLVGVSGLLELAALAWWGAHLIRLMVTPAARKEAPMIDLGWSAPTKRVDAGTARHAILSQHRKLRGLLERAGCVAEAALDGRPPSPDAVASVIGDIRLTMEVHLTFEERVLLPLLRDDLPVGPERADRLLDEHTRQRAMLATLSLEAVRHPELPTLAAKLAHVTAWLLADMAEEERCLIVADVVRDDIVAIDQTCG
jgi:hypothetical protein